MKTYWSNILQLKQDISFLSCLRPRRFVEHSSGEEKNWSKMKFLQSQHSRATEQPQYGVWSGLTSSNQPIYIQQIASPKIGFGHNKKICFDFLLLTNSFFFAIVRLFPLICVVALMLSRKNEKNSIKINIFFGFFEAETFWKNSKNMSATILRNIQATTWPYTQINIVSDEHGCWATVKNPKVIVAATFTNHLTILKFLRMKQRSKNSRLG